LLIVREPKAATVMTNKEEKNRDKDKDKKEKILAIVQPIKIGGMEAEEKGKSQVNPVITITTKIMTKKLIITV